MTTNDPAAARPEPARTSEPTGSSEPADAFELDAVRASVRETVDAWRDRLLELDHGIHDDPELAFEEHHAARRVADLLAEAGFETTVGVYGVATAVEASYGSGEVVVALCAEYDALPSLGHACGHNIIATAGVGAAIALASVADRLGIRVKLLGTPAEEHGGGKAVMLAGGAWEDATVSLMVHGGPAVDVRADDFVSQAVDRFDVTYTGRAAHAAAAPQAGINAADAATVAQVAIGLLRQQLGSGVRVSAFVAEGGEATNIIPARTVVRCEVRSFDMDELRDVKARVLACFEAGALASGCSWRLVRSEPLYASLRQEPLLASRWNEALSLVGRHPVERGQLAGGSTDMGNVTQVVPGIHPMIAVHGATAPPHTIEFAAAAATPEGDRAALDAALALAYTVASFALDPGARAELLRRQAERPTGATTVSQDIDE